MPTPRRMQGPSGSGKTTLARSLAAIARANFVEVRPLESKRSSASAGFERALWAFLAAPRVVPARRRVSCLILCGFP